MPQATALIDGNNFYASCEQSLDPALIGQPVVVLSNNDGCIVARSAEARALGIRMGTPYFKARRELERHNVVVRSSNYALYADMSQRMMSLLEAHCEELEVYSIDEAFGRIRRPRDGDLQGWARQLRARARQNLGLPIAIGLGASKAQAKLANRLAKQTPDHAGMFDLGQCDNPDRWLETIAIEDVWGIGRQLAHWCRLRGVSNARHLRDMPSGELRAKCGVVGLRLQRELRGHACLPLELAPAPKQETCVSRSFSRPITSQEELHQAIATYVVRAAEKLRKQRQRAAALTIYTRTSPFAPGFYSQAASTQLDLPSNDTAVLLQAARPPTSLRLSILPATLKPVLRSRRTTWRRTASAGTACSATRCACSTSTGSRTRPAAWPPSTRTPCGRLSRSISSIKGLAPYSTSSSSSTPPTRSACPAPR